MAQYLVKLDIEVEVVVEVDPDNYDEAPSLAQLDEADIGGQVEQALRDAISDGMLSVDIPDVDGDYVSNNAEVTYVFTGYDLDIQVIS